MNEVFPERRRNTRYVTLKNAVIMAVALSVAMSIVSIWHEVRPARSRPDGSLPDRTLLWNLRMMPKWPVVHKELNLLLLQK